MILVTFIPNLEIILEVKVMIFCYSLRSYFWIKSYFNQRETREHLEMGIKCTDTLEVYILLPVLT